MTRLRRARLAGALVALGMLSYQPIRGFSFSELLVPSSIFATSLADSPQTGHWWKINCGRKSRRRRKNDNRFYGRR
jgi:hypothetical protein